MKSGFRDTLDFILKKFGMTNRDAIGTVWSVGESMWLIIQAMGYRVERGISHPTYDYIIISEKKSILPNVLDCLTKLNSGGILVFRLIDELKTIKVMNALPIVTGHKLFVYEYGENKLLGVLGKNI